MGKTFSSLAADGEGTMRFCEMCGVDFYPKSDRSTVKYCDECRRFIGVADAVSREEEKKWMKKNEVQKHRGSIPMNAVIWNRRINYRHRHVYCDFDLTVHRVAHDPSRPWWTTNPGDSNWYILRSWPEDYERAKKEIKHG